MDIKELTKKIKERIEDKKNNPEKYKDEPLSPVIQKLIDDQNRVKNNCHLYTSNYIDEIYKEYCKSTYYIHYKEQEITDIYSYAESLCELPTKKEIEKYKDSFTAGMYILNDRIIVLNMGQGASFSVYKRLETIDKWETEVEKDGKKIKVTVNSLSSLLDAYK